MIDENKLAQIKKMIATAEDALLSAKLMLEEKTAEVTEEETTDFSTKAKEVGKISGGGRIVEGVFDGLNMIGPEGKLYNVPANYASKSKLVEGDVLKLTIADDGSFVFKQIGPIDRKRLIGMLIQDEPTGEFQVLANGKSYKVLLASITYFKGEVGDEVVILAPVDKQSTWAAVENIVKGGKTAEDPNAEDLNKEEGSVVVSQDRDKKITDNKSELENLEI